MSPWHEFNDFGQHSVSGGFFHEMPFFFKIFILFFFGFIAFIIIKSLRTWMTNNASPLIKVRSTAVTKRTEVWGGGGDSRAQTSYYVTFQLVDGNRLELQVRDQDYGLIVEGDRGELLY